MSFADNCLARSTVQRSKQRTVKSMFSSASASAARRCRQMVEQQGAPSPAAPASASAAAISHVAGTASPSAGISKRLRVSPDLGPQQQAPQEAIMSSQAAEQPPLMVSLAAVAAPETRSGRRIAAHSAAVRLRADDLTQPRALALLLEQPTQPLPPELLVGVPHVVNAESSDGTEVTTSPCSPKRESTTSAACEAASVGREMHHGSCAAVAPVPTVATGECTPQKQIISRQAVLPGISPLTTVSAFTACVVGRRFQPAAE